MIPSNHPIFSQVVRKIGLTVLSIGLAIPALGQNATYTMESGETGTLSPTSSSLVNVVASDMAFFNVADTGFSTSQGSNGAYADASGNYNFYTSTPKPGADDPYYAFTLTPESGASIELNSISFGARTLTEPNVAAPAPGPQSYEIYTSIDGYASPVASGSFTLEAGDSNFWYHYSHSGLDLLADIDASVEIRIYFLGAQQGISRGGSFRIDDLKISATASLGGGDTWAGYPVDNGFVTTGDWMGTLYISNAPWVYSYSLEAWIYLPEPMPEDAGAWTYVLR